MNLIIKERGSGKTTELIHTSEATQFPIVVFNKKQIDLIKEKAKNMRCVIPDPMCFNDFRGDMVRGRILPTHILVDEVGLIIEDALNAYFGTNVVAATMSNLSDEKYNGLLNLPS